jgi:hypothetical protein
MWLNVGGAHEALLLILVQITLNVDAASGKSNKVSDFQHFANL